MHKIYWLEYVNVNDNHHQDGIITETFWYKSDMNRRRYELMNDDDLEGIEHGFDMVDLD